jgi:hypothetical protein
MVCRPQLGRHPIGPGFSVGALGAVPRCARGLGTNATAGFVYNYLGPWGTFTNRVQRGFGQVAQQHGLVSFLSFLHPARKGMR